MLQLLTQSSSLTQTGTLSSKCYSQVSSKDTFSILAAGLCQCHVFQKSYPYPISSFPASSNSSSKAQPKGHLSTGHVLMSDYMCSAFPPSSKSLLGPGVNPFMPASRGPVLSRRSALSAEGHSDTS